MGPFDESWLIAAVALTAPLLLAATGELVSERAGVFNIGLEGMMLVGAFTAFLIAWHSGSAWLGVLAAAVAGIAFAAVMALVSVNAGGEQIIAGLGLLILSTGLTVYANQEIFAERARVSVESLAQLRIPGLDDLPWIGEALFAQTPLAYLAYLSVPLVYVLLWRTPLGLAIRASGEAPAAVAAAGISVRRARWLGTLAAGAGGGLAGAQLTVGSVGIFNDGMSNGRGFIALAVVVFGRWRPLGVLGACLVIGGADALQLRLQATGTIPPQVWLLAAIISIGAIASRIRGPGAPSVRRLAVPVALLTVAAGLIALAPAWTLPAQMWLMLPYAITILVLAGLLGRARMPSALGTPYQQQRSHP